MKKLVFAFVAVLVAAGATLALAHGSQGRASGTSLAGRTGCSGSMYGRPMMGQRMGMRGGRMGHGMMGRSWMGSRTRNASPRGGLSHTPGGQLSEPLTKVQVLTMAEQYTAGNPNLKIGKVAEKDGTYTVEIVTRKGNALVDKLVIDKTTGTLLQPGN